MHVLLVKLSSMGDLIHALPALTDASRCVPGIRFDWVCDKNFSEVAQWHPSVNRIITTRHRYWRKHLFESVANGEIREFYRKLRLEKYDAVIDAQSSLKSALAARLSHGTRHGLDIVSASEKLASFAYQKTYLIPKDMHAIPRLRLLFSQALNYDYPSSDPDYGISQYPFPALKFELTQPYIVLVHNASWHSKLWPEHYWRSLIEMARSEGLKVVLPWGNSAEKMRAEKITQGFENAQVLPFCSLSEQARILLGSKGAICSDTGLAHLAAALNVPSVTLYGSTDSRLIGTTGSNQHLFNSPFSCTKCYQYDCYFNHQKHPDALCALAIQPEKVWEIFQSLPKVA
jgi:heptosyltransferase-1